MPTQNTDVSGNPYGLTYAGPGLNWKIAKNVDVTGTVGAIYSGFVNSTLVNKGDLFGGTFGVFFEALGGFSTYKINNKASGEISSQYGVYIANFLGSAKIDNAGDINGSQFGIFTAGSPYVEVMNTGEIGGAIFAVFIAGSVSGAKGPLVDNYGMIDSPQFGLYMSDVNNTPGKLNNHEGAVIKGGLAAVYELLPLTFKNEGKVIGKVWTSEYNDKIVNKGKGKLKGDVALNGGDDLFKNKGDAKATGLIDLGYGNDKAVLGDKAEKLLFDSTLNSSFNVDTIKKFASGKDMFYLDDDIFSTIATGTLSPSAFHQGSSASDADDRIIYDKASGALYYDPDGIGGLSQVQFAKLDGSPKLKASDFTIGEYSIFI